MNPSVTFDEAAGHEFHGNQWTGGGSGKVRGGVKIVNRMMSAVQDKNGNLKPDAGFTIDARTKTDVTKGYAVDAFPHRSLEVDPKATDRAGMKQKISEWINNNSKLLSDPRVKIGGWVDPASGHFWLGATRVYDESERSMAIGVGRRANQIAIAHLSAIHKCDWNNAFVNTGGTGKATGDSMPKQKPILVLFDNDADPESILSAMLSHIPGGSVTVDANPEGINQYTGALKEAKAASVKANNGSNAAAKNKLDHATAAMRHNEAARMWAHASVEAPTKALAKEHNAKSNEHRLAAGQHRTISNGRGGNDL